MSKTQLSFSPQIEGVDIYNLTEVENFTISNEHGSVRYLEPVNLSQIPQEAIEEILIIESGNIEFKQPDSINLHLNSAIRRELNKSCLLTFNNLFDPRR